jgi:hypothetical protein
MELLNIWLPLIGGGLLWAITIGAFFSENKITGVWFGFVGTVCLLFLFALHLHEHFVVERDAATATAPPTSKADSPDRPWVSLDVGIAGSLAYGDIGRVGGPSWHIPIMIALKNTGNTPAFGVETTVKMMPFLFGERTGEGEQIRWTDVADELKKMCDGVAGLASAFPKSGRTLFRDQPSGGTTNIVGDPADFVAMKTSPLRFSGNFVILVCVTYGPARKVKSTKPLKLLHCSGPTAKSTLTVRRSKQANWDSPRSPWAAVSPTKPKHIAAAQAAQRTHT